MAVKTYLEAVELLEGKSMPNYPGIVEVEADYSEVARTLASDPLIEYRVRLLVAIACAWRNDWTGSCFDGRDGKHWIFSSLVGDKELLDWVKKSLGECDMWDGSDNG